MNQVGYKTKKSIKSNKSILLKCSYAPTNVQYNQYKNPMTMSDCLPDINTLWFESHASHMNLCTHEFMLL